MSTRDSDRNRVRAAVKAIIIVDRRLLVTVNRDADGDWFLLPGGGVEFGESMHQALQRECREEIGTEVVIGEPVCLRDYIGSRHEFAASDSDFHQLEIMFECRLPDGAEPAVGHAGDQEQTGVAWVHLDDLPHRLYPRALRDWLVTDPTCRSAYLGPVN